MNSTILKVANNLKTISNVFLNNFHTTTRTNVKVKNLRGRNISSQKWLRRQLNDPYVNRAKLENFRCRSAFKLLEIDDRYQIFHDGDTVIDCGASPGSWSQVVLKRINNSDVKGIYI